MNVENTMKVEAVKDAMRVTRTMDKNEARRFDKVIECVTLIDMLPEEVGELMLETVVRAMKRPSEIRQRLATLKDAIVAKYGEAAFNECRRAGMYRRNYRANVIRNAFWDAEGKAMANEYADLYAQDEARDYGMDEAVRRSIADTSKKVVEIIHAMCQQMNGMPDGCECDAGWGVGGYFNGTLVKGDRRVSFKSFLAGGWNIQRLHIRVRFTTLKRAA